MWTFSWLNESIICDTHCVFNFLLFVLSLRIFWVLWWISSRGEECWKEKPQRGSEDPLRSLIQSPAHGSALLLQRVLWMTKARCAAAQEGVSPFEAGTLTKRRIGLKDAPQQDTDCYQVSLLNIETSPFEHVGSVCDGIKRSFSMLELIYEKIVAWFRFRCWWFHPDKTQIKMEGTQKVVILQNTLKSLIRTLIPLSSLTHRHSSLVSGPALQISYCRYGCSVTSWSSPSQPQ